MLFYNHEITLVIFTIKKLASVGISYKKANCQRNPFTVLFESPLSAFELYLIEIPNEIRCEIMNSLDLVLSEYYFDEIKSERYAFYK